MRVHLGLRLTGRHAGLQRPDDVVVFTAAELGRLRAERQRQHELGVLGAVERRHHLARQRERRRQHADDLMGQPVHDDGRADDVRIAAVAAHPRAVTEHGGGRGAGQVLLGDEQTPERRARAEHRQQVRGHADGADPLRLASAGQVVVPADRDGDLLESVMPGLDVEVLRRGEPVLRDAQAGRAVPEDDQPVGVLIRKRTQQQCARDAEDGRVRPDAERDREHGRGREAGRSRKRTNRVARVLYHRIGSNKTGGRENGRLFSSIFSFTKFFRKNCSFLPSSRSPVYAISTECRRRRAGRARCGGGSATRTCGALRQRSRVPTAGA